MVDGAGLPTPKRVKPVKSYRPKLGVRIRGTLDIDPLNEVPFKRAISGVRKGPL